MYRSYAKYVLYSLLLNFCAISKKHTGKIRLISTDMEVLECHLSNLKTSIVQVGKLCNSVCLVVLPLTYVLHVSQHSCSVAYFMPVKSLRNER